jgi:hypothetical protein
MHLRSLQALLAVGLVGCGGAAGSSHGVTVGTMPDQGTFRGVWRSPETGDMELCESEGHVIGQYTSGERSGVIQGDVEGDVLFFEWREDLGMITRAGHGYLRIAPDGASHLAGEWGLGEDLRGNGELAALRVDGAQPVHCYDGLRRL